jgi:hypothetical protein
LTEGASKQERRASRMRSIRDDDHSGDVMGTGISGRGLHRDTRVKFGDRLHDDGLGGDAQPVQHKDRELMAVRDGNAELIEQFLIGARGCFEEQNAQRIALRQEICCRGSSGDFVIEDGHEISPSRWSLFDESPAQLGEYRLVPCPESCRPDKENQEHYYG